MALREGHPRRTFQTIMVAPRGAWWRRGGGRWAWPLRAAAGGRWGVIVLGEAQGSAPISRGRGAAAAEGTARGWHAGWGWGRRRSEGAGAAPQGYPPRTPQAAAQCDRRHIPFQARTVVPATTHTSIYAERGMSREDGRHRAGTELTRVAIWMGAFCGLQRQCPDISPEHWRSSRWALGVRLRWPVPGAEQRSG